MREHDLDLVGLKCPLPALRTRARMTELPPGDVLVVRTTDPMAALDIPHEVRRDGEVLDRAEAGGVLVLRIRKRAP